MQFRARCSRHTPQIFAQCLLSRGQADIARPSVLVCSWTRSGHSKRSFHSVTYRAVSECPCRFAENTTRAFEPSGACNLPIIMFGAGRLRSEERRVGKECKT